MKFNINDLPEDAFDDLDALNKALAAHIEGVNNSAIADFQGLSPTQMHALLRNTFQPDSPLQVNSVTEAQLARSPMFLIALDLLKAVQAAGGFKATAKGNLPPAVCKEVYAKGHIEDEYITAGFNKANKEEDFWTIHVAHIVSKATGLLRKYKGKILLTKQAEKLLLPENLNSLFWKFLEGYCKSFNWGYLDGIEHEGVAQHEMGFLMYLFLLYGDQGRPTSFYAEHCMKAFPVLEEVLKQKPSPYQRANYTPLKELESAISIRFFKRFACWFGFAEDVSADKKALLSPQSYQKTALLDEVFGIKGKGA